LTDSELESYKNQHDIYTINSKKMTLSEAFKLYESMEKELIPVVNNLNE
jgi:hypothetical protein